eukprot:4427255-Prymnesium_polylepis.1
MLQCFTDPLAICIGPGEPPPSSSFVAARRHAHAAAQEERAAKAQVAAAPALPVFEEAVDAEDITDRQSAVEAARKMTLEGIDTVFTPARRITLETLIAPDGADVAKRVSLEILMAPEQDIDSIISR